MFVKFLHAKVINVLGTSLLSIQWVRFVNENLKSRTMDFRMFGLDKKISQIWKGIYMWENVLRTVVVFLSVIILVEDVYAFLL